MVPVTKIRKTRIHISRLCTQVCRIKQSILFLSSQSATSGHQVYSLIQCRLTVNECDRQILAGNDERINSHCLTRIRPLWQQPPLSWNESGIRQELTLYSPFNKMTHPLKTLTSLILDPMCLDHLCHLMQKLFMKSSWPSHCN